MYPVRAPVHHIAPPAPTAAAPRQVGGQGQHPHGGCQCSHTGWAKGQATAPPQQRGHPSAASHIHHAPQAGAGGPLPQHQPPRPIPSQGLHTEQAGSQAQGGILRAQGATAHHCAHSPSGSVHLPDPAASHAARPQGAIALCAAICQVEQRGAAVGVGAAQGAAPGKQEAGASASAISAGSSARASQGEQLGAGCAAPGDIPHAVVGAVAHPHQNRGGSWRCCQASNAVEGAREGQAIAVIAPSQGAIGDGGQPCSAHPAQPVPPLHKQVVPCEGVKGSAIGAGALAIAAAGGAWLQLAQQRVGGVSPAPCSWAPPSHCAREPTGRDLADHKVLAVSKPQVASARLHSPPQGKVQQRCSPSALCIASSPANEGRQGAATERAGPGGGRGSWGGAGAAGGPRAGARAGRWRGSSSSSHWAVQAPQGVGIQHIGQAPA